VLLGAQQKALRWVAPPQRPAPESPVAADPSTESEAPREPLTLAVTLPDAFAPRSEHRFPDGGISIVQRNKAVTPAVEPIIPEADGHCAAPATLSGRLPTPPLMRLPLARSADRRTEQRALFGTSLCANAPPFQSA